MRAAALFAAGVAVCLIGLSGPAGSASPASVGTAPAAFPSADPSPAGRAGRIVDAQIRSPSSTVTPTEQLAPLHADLESGDDRRVGAALAVADEIAAAIERARAPAGRSGGEIPIWPDSLEPLVVDLQPLLDGLHETVDCQLVARVDRVADRFHRLPRGHLPQAQPAPPPGAADHALSKRALVCAMNSIKGQIAACFARYQTPGTAMVNVSVTRQGAVRVATTTGKFAGTPTGDCVAAAVKTVTFPPSDGVSFPYPFLLGSPMTPVKVTPPPTAEPPARIVTTQRPLYFERVLTDADLDGRGADELRLMRNTIFARSGRTFEDRALRDYFSRQPWYRPAARPAKLGAVDQKNLAGIKLWETRAKALEGLAALVPGFEAAASSPTPDDCGVDARHVLRNRRDERQLILEAGRLPWAEVPGFDNTSLDALGTKMKAVRVVCGPDLDADGFPEAVVTLTRPYEVPAGEERQDPESIDLIFLASRHGSKWRAVVPLAFAGSIPGVEGSVRTSVWFVKLADGRRALAIRSAGGGGGDCDCDSEDISIATLEHGKLHPRGTFETGQPCECQYAGDE